MTDWEEGSADERGEAVEISEAALDEREYFLTGQWHVEHVLGLLRRVFDPAFAPERVLDIGCGRGRVTLALAQRASAVTAVEPNVAWADEARCHAHTLGLTNIEWFSTGAELAGVRGPFDFVHACVTPERPTATLVPDLQRLVQLLAPRGLAVVQINLQDDPPGGPVRALQGLLRAHVRHCHVELHAGRDEGRATLYFSGRDPQT